MSAQAAISKGTLFEQDETAWLEQTASLVAQRRFDEIDHVNLSEYLADMAKRDRREVYSRLRTLLAHLLKWEHQPDHRSNSWRGTILTQRSELRQLLENGTLRRHAEEILAEAYAEAVELAATETGLGEEAFPAECFLTLDEILTQKK